MWQKPSCNKILMKWYGTCSHYKYKHYPETTNLTNTPNSKWLTNNHSEGLWGNNKTR